jgi:hypothetical protein
MVLCRYDTLSSITPPTSGVMWMLNDGGGVDKCALGMLISTTNGSCFGYNGTIATWFDKCEIQTTRTDFDPPLYGVFQTLSTRHRGGMLKDVEWDDANCICTTTACPATIVITGLDGHGIGAVGTMSTDLVLSSVGYVAHV